MTQTRAGLLGDVDFVLNQQPWDGPFVVHQISPLARATLGINLLTWEQTYTASLGSIELRPNSGPLHT